jgi:hypothetical protein
LTPSDWLPSDWSQLQASELSAILEETRAVLANLSDAVREEVETEIAYFVHNAQRMDYASFRAQGLFIRSGVVEAGCKILVGQRLKNSGMFWSQNRARNILTIRCALKSQNRFVAFWKAHAAA